jgi:hypothetical protein
MDDASGIVANDASGNGRSGAIEPNTVLQAPGPEADTFAFGVPAAPGGIISGFTNPYAGSVHMTMLGWFSASNYPSGHDTLLQVGAGGLRGQGIGANADQVELVFDGIGFVSNLFPIGPGLWHMFGFEINPGVVQTAWLDGVQIYTAAAGTPNPVMGGDPVYAQSVQPCLMAHAAFFTGAISTAQQATIVGARTNPQESRTSGRPASDIDVSALEQKIADCCAAILASVRKTY